MGDRVWYLCYAGPTAPDAGAVMTDIERAMRAAGLIEGSDDPTAILRDTEWPVFRPGPALDWLPQTMSFRGLLTNGAEFKAGPIFNIGPFMQPELLSCPHCGWYFLDEEAPEHDPSTGGTMLDQLGEQGAAGNFSEDALSCLRCGQASALNGWARPGDFIIAGSGLALWNWQHLPEIRDPIIAIMTAARPGHPLVESGYKI